MQKINSNQKEKIFGGLAATAIFSIAGVVMMGINLISSIVVGALNIKNSIDQKNKKQQEISKEPLEYHKNFDTLAYTNII